MITIDPQLIGRKYITNNSNISFTLRGIYAQTNGKPIVIGEYTIDPNLPNSPHGLTTHQLSEIKLQ